ncbi:MAG: ATP-binding cassette domain-containing protein [Candidatus Dojkabacteria bacterium]|nr:ATP-binding cassette domain-containing protein [Candidatus Dojkabacteria bacterium]
MLNNVVLKVNNVTKRFLKSKLKYQTFREYFWNLPHEIYERLKSILNISSSYQTRNQNTFTVLEDISFEVKRGEFVSIIGKNGSGKSTLLKILAGIYIPDDGNIEVYGKIIPFLELGVGFNTELTAKENVYLNGIVLGLTRKEVDQFYDQIIDFAEVREFENMKLKYFSSGMQVRLAFSVAIHAQGDIYLLDEVFAVGDINFQKKALDAIHQIIKSGKTIIYVGHGMDTVRKYSSNVIYLKEKKIAATGISAIDTYVADQSSSGN